MQRSNSYIMREQWLAVTVDIKHMYIQGEFWRYNK